MVTSTDSGHTRHGSKHARTPSSRSTRGRSSKPKPSADDAAAQTPDVEDIRRKREMYYANPREERKRHSASDLARSLSRDRKGDPKEAKDTVRPLSRRSTTDSHRSQRHRRVSDSGKVEKRGPGRSRTQDFVYTSRHAERDAGRHEHRPPRSPSPVSSLSTIADNEVTPDDSVSQVAERMYSRHYKAPSRSQSTAKRSITKTAKLDPIEERHTAQAPAPPARRSSKRDSTLFGSLWRREPPAAASPPKPKLVECLTCGSDDVPYARSAKLACGHRMCHSCLKRIFTMSVKDPAHMPPRCCTRDHIPLKHVDRLFDTKFKVLWNRKYEEYNTKNRVYCPAPKCGEWIKPSHIRTSMGRKYAQCPRCLTKVCLVCNSKLHRAKECPKDPAIIQLEEQAKEEGWQSCYNCHAMVELKEGCNHMTCRCTAEFCMKCGAKWKSCACPWFNYNQLPDPGDQLNDMRVPTEPRFDRIRQLFEVARGLAGYGAAAAATPAPPPNPPAPTNPAPRAETQHRREMTYDEETQLRRNQERLDADLARRMQFASLLGSDDDRTTNSSRDQPGMETWGVGNAAPHFMNDDFVQTNAQNITMSQFGDTAFGRRGERAAGRRRQPRAAAAAKRASAPQDAGLVPNFLGDESVLGGPRRAR